ncbi:alpha/beta fold hydrolase [Subtercola lobariae]|nr:alpha/beta hydrolase [Subtercola lobariae]
MTTELNALLIDEISVCTNGTRLNVATAGSGSPVLLMHGFPHTWRVWSAIIPVLAETHRVIAPDLRGLGASQRDTTGYDARNLATDMLGVLDALDEPQAAVVAIDAGAPPAFLLGLEHPARVSRLVLMESTIGRLPGAEDFFRAGPPWWFGFHAVPGLAETVLEGHEAEYIDFFLRQGTANGAGVDVGIRDAFVRAYVGRDSLRAAFEHYRAMPTNAAQIAEATANHRLTIPTLAIGGQVVGAATGGQLQPISDHFENILIPSSGHIVPLDQPAELLTRLLPFLMA